MIVKRLCLVLSKMFLKMQTHVGINRKNKTFLQLSWKGGGLGSLKGSRWDKNLRHKVNK